MSWAQTVSTVDTGNPAKRSREKENIDNDNVVVEALCFAV